VDCFDGAALGERGLLSLVRSALLLRTATLLLPADLRCGDAGARHQRVSAAAELDGAGLQVMTR
jgi:hypothetical protein